MATKKKTTNHREGALEKMGSRGEKALTIRGPKPTVTAIKTEADYLAVASHAKVTKGLLKALADRYEEIQEEIIRPLLAVVNRQYDKHRASKRDLEGMLANDQRLLNGYAEKQRTKAIKTAERKAKRAPNREIGRELVKAAAEDVHVPKVSGISYTTAYEYEIENEKKIPIDFNGICLRPIDERAIKKLVKASKGTIEIPGVVCRTIDNAKVKA